MPVIIPINMFEYNGHIQVLYIVPDESLVSFFFRIISILSICPFPKFFPLNDIKQFSPIQIHWPPILTLP